MNQKHMDEMIFEILLSINLKGKGQCLEEYQILWGALKLAWEAEGEFYSLEEQPELVSWNLRCQKPKIWTMGQNTIKIKCVLAKGINASVVGDFIFDYESVFAKVSFGIM